MNFIGDYLAEGGRRERQGGGGIKRLSYCNKCAWKCVSIASDSRHRWCTRNEIFIQGASLHDQHLEFYRPIFITIANRQNPAARQTQISIIVNRPDPTTLCLLNHGRGKLETRRVSPVLLHNYK